MRKFTVDTTPKDLAWSSVFVAVYVFLFVKLFANKDNFDEFIKILLLVIIWMQCVSNLDNGAKLKKSVNKWISFLLFLLVLDGCS